MKNREYKTKEEVLTRGQEAVGKTLGEIDKTGRIATGKGAIGTVVEESWFGYKPNSNPAPDFEEAGQALANSPLRSTFLEAICTYWLDKTACGTFNILISSSDT